jgi:ribosomal protein S18 acetylase RimI-like enzyme
MTRSDDEQIYFLEMTTISHAQIIRKIRNECKDYMTRSSEYITEEQQEKWFNNLDADTTKVYLMYFSFHGVVFETLGFGYCKNDDNETYLTGGLKEAYRGKGYGRMLFSHLLEQAKTFNMPVTLEVLNTNTKAENLYKSLGFVEISRNDKVTKMEYRI